MEMIEVCYLECIFEIQTSFPIKDYKWIGYRSTNECTPEGLRD
jgi:hypothetical protein